MKKDENKVGGLRKAGTIASVVGIGLADALINGPIVRPFIRTIQTGKIVVRAVKAQDDKDLDDCVVDTIVNLTV